MPGPEQKPNREEQALQALISASLHQTDDEVSMEEIRPYLGEIELSAEDEEALKRQGKPGASAEPFETQLQSSESEAFLALHRKRPPGGFSQKTEEEIKKKRQELLEKLRKKKGRG
jgi:hypothetical protein